MKSKVPNRSIGSPLGNQLGLGLGVEIFGVERDNRLLDAVGLSEEGKNINFREEENAFPFKELIIPAPLSYIPIRSGADGHTDIGGDQAYEELTEIVDDSTKPMPLCMWAIDTVIGHQTRNGSPPKMPPKPGDRKVIVLTQGKFRLKNGQGRHNLSLRYVCLKEGDDGHMRPCTVGHFDMFRLYAGWDLVALCVPRSYCVLS
jgi:hypothetical protein